MINIDITYDLPVPPKVAFALLSDPAQEPDWSTACVGAEALDGPARSGARYEMVFAMVGRRMDFTVEITDHLPGRRSAFTVLEGPFHYQGAYVYTERPDGNTTVNWTLDVQPGTYFGVMPLALVKKLFVSQTRKDAARLAERLAQGDAA